MSSEQFRGENWKGGGIVEVKAPICNGDSNVNDQNVAHKNIDNGEERADERAKQERGNSRPVKGEGSKAKAFHAWAKLLGCHWVGEGPTHPRDAC